MLCLKVGFLALRGWLFSALLWRSGVLGQNLVDEYGSGTLGTADNIGQFRFPRMKALTDFHGDVKFPLPQRRLRTASKQNKNTFAVFEARTHFN